MHGPCASLVTAAGLCVRKRYDTIIIVDEMTADRGQLIAYTHLVLDRWVKGDDQRFVHADFLGLIL